MNNIPRNTQQLSQTLILLPTVRNLEEALTECLEYDAVITAGPQADEVSDFGHPLHKVVDFRDTSMLTSGGPTYENVCELMEFGIGVPKLLVHCHAGISRSTATAWGVAIGNGVNPLEAFLQLKQNHPNERGFSGFRHGVQRTFAPNKLIVSHLEKYFNLEGVLTPIRDKYASRGW